MVRANVALPQRPARATASCTSASGPPVSCETVGSTAMRVGHAQVEVAIGAGGGGLARACSTGPHVVAAWCRRQFRRRRFGTIMQSLANLRATWRATCSC
eukprot:4143127-Prymnesium_polylepis.1